MFFPATYAQVALTIAEDAVVAVKGRTDTREDAVKLIASDLVAARHHGRGPARAGGGAHGAGALHAADGRPAADVLATHPGTTEVQLHLVNGAREHLLRLGDGYRVTPSPALMGDLKALLGPDRRLGLTLRGTAPAGVRSRHGAGEPHQARRARGSRADADCRQAGRA